MRASALRRRLAAARGVVTARSERRPPWAPRDPSDPPKRRKPRQVEKPIQAAIKDLLLMLGAKLYVLGTRRKRGDHQGTRQSPGLPDLLAFLPPRATAHRVVPRRLLIVEVKPPGGKMSPEQEEFRMLCLEAQIGHVVGDLDAVIAWLLREGYLKPHQVAWYRLPPSHPGGDPPTE